MNVAFNAQTAISQLLHDLPSAATATFLALFPIVNPLGAIPLFFGLTSDFSPEERHRTALRTAGYVVAILIVFMLLGRFVLNFFWNFALCVEDRRRTDCGEHGLGNGDVDGTHHAR